MYQRTEYEQNSRTERHWLPSGCDWALLLWRTTYAWALRAREKMAALFLPACLTLFFQPAIAAEGKRITVYLPEAPPLASSSEVHPRYAHEITEKALVGCGFELTFHYEPWKRAQASVLRDRLSIIIPLARNPQREPKYRWIVPIVKYHSALATIGAPLNSISDITPSMKIGVVSGTAHWDFLIASGVNPSQLVEMTSTKSLILMITRGRVDAWFEGVPEFVYRFHESETDAQLVVGRPLLLTDLYIAAGKAFPDEMAREISDCVSSFTKGPEYAQIVKPYLPN